MKQKRKVGEPDWVRIVRRGVVVFLTGSLCGRRDLT